MTEPILHLSPEDIALKVEALSREVRVCMAGLAEGALKLPDNPAIHRLPGNVNAFIVSSSQLTKGAGKDGKSSNWTPFHHDWRRQYEYIAEQISQITFDSTGASRRLREILEKHRVTSDASHLRDGDYSPEVVNNARPHIEAALKIAQSIAKASPATGLSRRRAP